MARNQISLTRRNGGLGRRAPSQDGVSALVVEGFATDDIAHGDIITLTSTTYAEQYGIDSSYDSTNGILVYRHIKEKFRIDPNNVLHLMIVPPGTTLAEMLDPTLPWAAKLLKKLNGAVRVLGVARNPDPYYSSPTIVEGLDEDVYNAIAKATELEAFEASKKRFIDSIVIEGRGWTGSSSALRNLRAPGASDFVASVMLCIDGAVAPYHVGSADVGTAIGAITRASVSENIGSQEPEFNIQSSGAWRTAALSSGQLFDDYADETMDEVFEKGYLVVHPGDGVSGLFFQDSPTAAEVTSDFCQIENNRTINKMIRTIRAAIGPKLKGKWRVDPVTGLLDAMDIQRFEALAETALVNEMVKASDLVAADAYINPSQNILSTSRLVVDFSGQSFGIARDITGSVGFENPSNA